jgi:hypothetical protein
MAPSVLLSLGLTVAGLVIAFIGDFWSGSVLGALLALGGTSAASYSMWKGVQKEGQGQAAASIVLIITSLGVAGFLLLLKIIHWLR